MKDTTRRLRELADNVEGFRLDMLFAEADIDQLEDGGEASLHFLTALGHLELAHRSLQLAALKAKEEHAGQCR